MNEKDKTSRPKPRAKPDPDDAWLNRRSYHARISQTVPITAEQFSALIAERERTKVGSKAFIAHFDDVPEGLNAAAIDRWANGKSRVAPVGHVEYVLEKYQSLPTPPAHVLAPLQAGRILITDEMRATLDSELTRTGAMLNQLVRKRSPDAHKLTANKISAWRNGRAKKANKAEWASVLATLETMPDRRT